MFTRCNLGSTLSRAVLAGVIAAGVGAVAGTVSAQDRPAVQGQQQSVEQVTANWREAAKKAAKQISDKYGSPQEVTATRLIWHNNGPWKTTIIYKEEVPHNWPKKHTDVLEQVIDHKVPPGKFDELAKFDGSVIAERTKGTLAARWDKEEMNFLALNLANDVATGKRSAREARDEYEKAVKGTMKGEMHPYMQKLQFEVPRDAGDPDETVIKQQ